MTEGDWNADFSRILDEIRSDPVHMRRFRQRREALWRSLDPQQREGHWPNDRGEPYVLSEEEFFEPFEDITVYVDFLCPRVIAPNGTVDERRALCRRADHEHVHEFFELAYVCSGSCYGYCDGEEYLMPPGTIWIFNTNVPHNVVLPDERVNLINILVRKSSFEHTMLGMMQGNDLFLNFFLHSIHDADVRPEHIRFHAEPGGILEEYVYHIVREYHNRDMYFENVMRMQLGCMLTELARRSRALAVNNKSTAREGTLDAARLIAYISDNSANVTLRQVADYFHYTTNYLSKFIRSHTGKSFSELILSFRMTRAAQCLRHTDLTLDQIAGMCGYSERTNFEKAFKRYWGKTPTQFIREDS